MSDEIFNNNYFGADGIQQIKIYFSSVKDVISSPLQTQFIIDLSYVNFVHIRKD